jgi:hypothetical protein
MLRINSGGDGGGGIWMLAGEGNAECNEASLHNLKGDIVIVN